MINAPLTKRSVTIIARRTTVSRCEKGQLAVIYAAVVRELDLDSRKHLMCGAAQRPISG
jgi:hypothetical protein